MVSLNSVSNLVSLQAGHKGQFKYGHKQPVRRRRADVHDDMTIVAAFFDWKGEASILSCLLGSSVSTLIYLVILPVATHPPVIWID